MNDESKGVPIEIHHQLDGGVAMIVPRGAFGSRDSLMDLLEAGMRVIAESVSEDDIGEWAEKYGVNFENDVFMMHRFCWCDQDECLWCTPCRCETIDPDNCKCSSNAEPNFRHKELGFELVWYKYIGRDMEITKAGLSAIGVCDMISECLKSLHSRKAPSDITDHS
jgi:hypothetical protein